MGIFNMKFFRFLGFKQKPSAPWSKYYGTNTMDLNIPDISLYEYFKKECQKHKNLTAINYYGTKISYQQLLEKIDECAKSFKYYGIRRGDVVTICMPNTPEGVITFLALNKIGAISNMVHPLSSENELKETLQKTGSVMLLIIDIDYVKIKNIITSTNVFKVIIAHANEYMPWYLNVGYKITNGYKIELPKKDNLYISWTNFLKCSANYNVNDYYYKAKKNMPATMLHSGGTTGTPKAIVLSNANFITLVEQSKIVFDELEVGDKCLAIMPIFHGFGLGVCVFTPLCLGAEVILIPQFKASEFDKLLNKHKPEFVIGVPTLFEALLKTNNKKLELSYLKYVISGGDTLKNTMEQDINEFLLSRGANTRVLQGYGMSECLAAVALNIKSFPKQGSIGIPFPGCYMGIFSPEDKEMPYGEEGEICISGPNVMLGYYNNVKETNAALHLHEDGNIWLHSGDLGVMDKNGFITYTSRLKRLIISSGYNVYPNQIEATLESHPAVMLCSVVGIPHPYKVEVPKAFIVLNKGYKPTDELLDELKKLCQKNLAKYAQPKEFEFRKSLPRTIVGKVDFKKLQAENNDRRKKDNENKEKV